MTNPSISGAGSAKRLAVRGCVAVAVSCMIALFQASGSWHGEQYEAVFYTILILVVGCTAGVILSVIALVKSRRDRGAKPFAVLCLVGAFIAPAGTFISLIARAAA